MKKFCLFFLLIILSILFKNNSVYAASCLSIQNVTFSNVQQQSTQTYFTCKVNVSSQDAGSPNVACGIKNDSQVFPKNYCPSDPPYFLGWQGNTATFNCVIPAGDTIIDPSQHPTLVGYDFSDNTTCGPDRGKSIALSGFTYNPSITPKAAGDDSQTQKIIREFLDIFLNLKNKLASGNGGTSSSNSNSSNSNSTGSTGNSSQVTYASNNVQTKNVVDTVNAIVNSCGNVISSSSISNGCLDRVTPALSQNLKSIIRKNISDGGGYFQCVGAARLATIVMGYPQMLPYGPGTACQYTQQAIAGYTFIPKGKSSIEVGDIPIWGTTPCSGTGHIAFVVNVLDANTFQVAEANYTANGYLGVRTTTLDYGSLKGWLRPNL